jgi:hypothetical protein
VVSVYAQLHLLRRCLTSLHCPLSKQKTQIDFESCLVNAVGNNCLMMIIGTDFCLVGNSNFWLRFLGPPSEAEFQICFRFRIFRSIFLFRILLLKSNRIEIPIPKIGIPIFLRRNSLHLMLYQKTIAISFPTKITSTCSTCKTNRCDFGGQRNHAAKLTSSQNK